MRIAVAQTPGTRLDQWRETLARVEDMIRRAADLQAQLVVLPECVWPMYCLGSKQTYVDARTAGLPPPDEFLARLQRGAIARRIAVCAGFVQEHGGRLFNAACLFCPDGRLIGVYRKCFLWAFDRDWFDPGEQIVPLDSGFARIGIMVCADARLPEIAATLAARGAELIVQPTAWVNAHTAEAPWNPQPDFLISARAGELGVPIASASKWGAESDTTFVGSSLIADAAGHILVQCGPRETAVVAADVAPVSDRSHMMQLTDEQRAALLDSRPPLKPSASAPDLPIVLLPPVVRDNELGLRIQAFADQRLGQPMLCLGPPAGRGVRGHPPVRIGNVISLGAPVDSLIDLGAARLAAVADVDARFFPELRCQALRGIHLAVVFGDEVRAESIRARACENCIFVAWVRPAGVTFVSPDGRVMGTESWPADGSAGQEVTLKLRQAANKEVAPRTDVLADRQPAQYGF